MSGTICTLLLLCFLATLAVQAVEIHIHEETARAVENTYYYGSGNITIDLTGVWNIVNSNGSVSLTGNVVGSVHTALYDAGLIGDPYYRYNDVLLRWIALDDWTYSRTFEVPAELLQQTEVLLICEGLDTIATISINNIPIGHSRNQFVEYVFPIKSALVEGTNTIEVAFISASAYANATAAAYPYIVPSSPSPTQEPNRNFIRKEQCSFAWDWGPCFIPQGIWQPLSIVGFSDAILWQEAIATQIFPQKLFLQASTEDNEIAARRQMPTHGDFRVEVEVIVWAAMDGVQASFILEVANTTAFRDAVILVSGKNYVVLETLVEGVALWWPRGYGDQPLYPLSVTMKTPSSTSTATTTVGFRKFEINTSPASNSGNYFFFEINDEPIFAKGANFVPADAFEERVTPAWITNLLQAAADANMNMVRVWGGGIYQQQAFYEICDQLGLMVWQEFMFACAMYPRNEEFLRNVEEEVDWQVRRLMSHPSIVLWSGNNENQAALGWFTQTIANPFLYVVDYDILYNQRLRSTLTHVDKSRPFWPSSPSNGVLTADPYVLVWGNPYSQTQGDLHYYNYEALCTNVSSFPIPRFASEYGFQSFPSLPTWQPVTEPSDWSAMSPLMQHRQHHVNGTEQLQAQLAMHFAQPVPTGNETVDFENWIFLTQCVQTMCIEAETEHYRRMKGTSAYTMGALYWQLNDIWQAPTWASLEWQGRWKMLHYAASKFFAPVLVSGFEQPQDTLSVWATSDVPGPIAALSGEVTIELWSWNAGNLLTFWTVPFTLSPQGSKQVYSGQISEMIYGFCERNEGVFILRMNATVSSTGEQFDSQNVFFLSNFAQVSLPPVTFTLSINVDQATQTAALSLTADCMAPFVFLQTTIPGRFSDNGFLMTPRVPVTLTFYGTVQFTKEQMQQTLEIFTVEYTTTGDPERRKKMIFV